MARDSAMPQPGAAGAANAITCAGLTKDYGNGHGVLDLDLTVGRGEAFGFIGSGKTTTIRAQRSPKAAT